MLLNCTNITGRVPRSKRIPALIKTHYINLVNDFDGSVSNREIIFGPVNGASFPETMRII